MLQKGIGHIERLASGSFRVSVYAGYGSQAGHRRGQRRIHEVPNGQPGMPQQGNPMASRPGPQGRTCGPRTGSGAAVHPRQPPAVREDLQRQAPLPPFQACPRHRMAVAATIGEVSLAVAVLRDDVAALGMCRSGDRR